MNLINTEKNNFVMIFVMTMAAAIAPTASWAQLADKAAAQAMVTKGAAAIQADGWKALVEMTAPRKTYVALLELMTPPKPRADAAATGKSAGGIELSGKASVEQDPQAEMVSRYRRKLSMALN